MPHNMEMSKNNEKKPQGSLEGASREPLEVASKPYVSQYGDVEDCRKGSIMKGV